MKLFLTAIVSFILGALAMGYMAQYTSQVFGQEQIIRAREGIVQLMIDRYRSGDSGSAAALATGVDLLETYKNREWPLLSPVTGTFNRISKPTGRAVEDSKYDAAMAAYLYSTAGREDEARPYYSISRGTSGLTKEQIDARAKGILDAISAFDSEQLKDSLRDDR
jgi:hypothetical protein